MALGRYGMVSLVGLFSGWVCGSEVSARLLQKSRHLKGELDCLFLLAFGIPDFCCLLCLGWIWSL
jgi:hypothetical protein